MDSYNNLCPPLTRPSRPLFCIEPLTHGIHFVRGYGAEISHSSISRFWGWLENERCWAGIKGIYRCFNFVGGLSEGILGQGHRLGGGRRRCRFWLGEECSRILPLHGGGDLFL